jgi:hypothetical protein
MAGYWLRPATDECVRVESTHDAWVRDWKNAQHLGLPPEVYAEIMRHPPTAVDEIRMLAVRCGLVRIREHPRYTSVQFSAEPHRVGAVLQATVKALHGVGIHPDTRLVVDNLLTQERVAMTIRELAVALDDGEQVFRGEDGG